MAIPTDTASGADRDWCALRRSRLAGARAAHDPPAQEQDRPETEGARDGRRQAADDRHQPDDLEDDDAEDGASVRTRDCRFLAGAQQLLTEEDAGDKEANEGQEWQQAEQDADARAAPPRS